VLEAVGGGPAHVFGSSGGAITGLALVAHDPGRVHTLVAHEPPLALLLPEAHDARSAMQDIYDTYRKGGTGAAWAKFFTFTGMSPPPGSGDAVPEPSPGVDPTSERFFGHGLLPIALYQPDLSALQSGPARVAVAGGTTSKGEFPQRTAAALAERLGTPLIDFPGGHGGFASDAPEFAALLRLTLT
jgi:clorobiocin/coumermycin A biosynthesis protein CloN7/CouN7